MLLLYKNVSLQFHQVTSTRSLFFLSLGGQTRVDLIVMEIMEYIC